MIFMLFPLFLHVWWSLEDLLPESGFCWKNDHQDTMFRKIGKFQKTTRKLYFARRLKKPEGGGERSHKEGSHTGGVGPPLVAPAYCVASLAHFCHRPFAYFIIPENLSQRGLRDRHRHLCGAENTRERKALRQAEIYWGNSFPERGDRRHRHHHRTGRHPAVTSWVESC
jgi:hypothetical protein